MISEIGSKTVDLPDSAAVALVARRLIQGCGNHAVIFAARRFAWESQEVANGDAMRFWEAVLERLAGTQGAQCAITADALIDGVT